MRIIMAEKTDKSVSFKESLNLPRTDFPIRSNAKEDDPAMIKRWEEEDLYSKSFTAHQGNEKFIFHDGPPYANGNIHLGSAYNKILKDIACKSRRMKGNHVPVTPGWDCHGLPIELKVTKEKTDLSREELIKECREYAKHWIGIQKEQFKGLGVLMNWDKPYLTMDFHYEAQELRALADFFEQGYIRRSNKTVPWCPSCQTVLASAEIEYQDRKDPSIYVFFPVSVDSIHKFFPNFIDKEVGLAVWTTTPWTLPLNRAVMANQDAEYVVISVGDRFVLIGKQLATQFCDALGIPCTIVQEIKAQDLTGLIINHPFIEKLQVPLIFDQNVLLDQGTAFVHSAPGAGPIDYEVGIKNNLEIYSPVGPDGKYTAAVRPQDLVGMPVGDGQIWVLKKLAELGVLLHKTTVRHSYPHCWRCRGGLIFRATKQWFFSLSHKNLRDNALKASEDIKTIPEKSINRLQSTIEARYEWCISRQRAWGVPIPALICSGCDYTYTNKEFIEQVAQGVQKDGVEYWVYVAVSDLISKAFKCPSCKSESFTKELDILDVWFDSGLSHYVVLFDNPELGYPADLYLEGKDQHRGWFQSSLLTSMALEKQAAMKMLITHGFTVDAKGVKMSKSLGNVVVPQEIIDKIGTDGLRLWASSSDFSSEAIVSETLLNNVQELFRKVRNTARFLLSNLYDFDITKDAVPLDRMRVADQYALNELITFNNSVRQAYDEYDFTAVFHHLGNYCSVNLSTFYFEIVKDILYVEKADSHARRSSQTACWYILDTMTKLMAPILSFTAEQVSDLYQKDKKESIHLQVFNDLDSMLKKLPTQDKELWHLLKSIRSAILKGTETLREKGEIKRSLDARVSMYIDPNAEMMDELVSFIKLLHKKGEDSDQFFKEFAIVSQLKQLQKKEGLELSSVPGIYLSVEKARGEKCPRCWQWAEDTNDQHLCQRCQDVLS
jgi:isoleucyl-tRNA synthetase